MTGLEKWQTATTQNIAAAGVSGYKKTDTSFSAQAQGGIRTGDFAGLLRTQTVSAQNSISFTQGQLTQTDNPLSVAIDGEGFFELERPDGSIIYSRDGLFSLSENGELMDRNGYRVLPTAGTIRFNPEDGPVSIGPEGMISQGDTAVAKLSVVRIANKENLARVTGGFAEVDGTDVGRETVETPRLLQGYYEASNVNPIEEMINLIQVSRAYQTNSKIVQSFDQLQGKVNQNLAV